MNFDELKVIWDTQEEAPMYAVREEDLRAVLRRNTSHFTRRMRWQRIQTYLATGLIVLPVVALLLIHFSGLRPLQTGWDVLALFVASGFWLYFGGRVLVRRTQQQEREKHVTPTLRDELDRDIAEVTHNIAGRQHIMRDFVPPHLGALLMMWVAFRSSDVTAWAIAPMAVILLVNFVFESRSQQRLVDRELIPRRRELESLRDKLASE